MVNLLGSLVAEAVSELSVNELERSHSAGSGGVSSLGLLTPVVGSDLGGGVSARGAGLLLAMERSLTTSSAESVGLGVLLTERSGTL